MSRCREDNLLTHSQLFRYKFPALAICLSSLATPWGVAQKATTPSAPAQESRICDGKPAQEPGPSNEKNALKLSTRGQADESTDPQGQFCKRDRSGQNSLKPSTGSSRPDETSEPAQSSTPIAQLKDGKLLIRATGQDFDAVLESIRAVSGFTVEMPPGSGSEPVFLTMGPVSVSDALVALIGGTKYNYFIVGSATDPQIVKKLILTERSAGPAALVASTEGAPAPGQPTLYGAQGMSSDAEAEAPEPPLPPTPAPAQPAVIPSSVPTGINVQKMAAESGKTPGQILDELQKHQQQVLDDQAASQSQSAPQ